MSQPQPTAEQIIEAYLLRLDDARRGGADEATEGESLRLARTRALDELTRDYPQHAEALARFAADEAVVDLTLAPAADAEAYAALERQGREIAVRMIAARRASPAETEATRGAAEVPASFASLRREAERRGFTLKELARRTGLSIALVAKLDRRLIVPESVPHVALERLAGAVGQTIETLAAYLCGDPQFAHGAAFRHDSSPQVGERQDFFDAVESDLTIAETDKRDWLELKTRREDA